MKRILFALVLTLFFFQDATAQSGPVVYSLPRTTVSLRVKARREAFTAGPYAQYAQKYFGVAASTQNRTTYTLQAITLTPYVEADPASRYTVSIPERASAGFLQMCTQGLVAMSDNYTGKPAACASRRSRAQPPLKASTRRATWSAKPPSSTRPS